MSTTTTDATVERLRVLLAQFGLPVAIVSDNGTNFVSNTFQEFLQRNGVRQVTTAPGHPSSNGLAEHAVRTFKEGVSRLKEDSMTARLSRFLFTYRNTPHPTTGTSPAELLQGRRSRSALDLMKSYLEGRVLAEQFHQAWKHDEHARARKFCMGDTAFARNFSPGDKWVPATVTVRSGSLSY